MDVAVKLRISYLFLNVFLASISIVLFFIKSICKRNHRIWLATFAATLLAVNTSGANAQNVGDAQRLAQRIAFELNDQLLDAGLFRCSGKETKTLIGILPFEAEKISVSINTANRLYTDILSVLGKTKPGCIDYLDEDNIRALVAQLSRTGALQSKGRKILNEFMKANQQVDIIITGRFLSSYGKTQVSFKAFKTKNGQMLAQTRSHELVGYQETGALDSAVALDTALMRAARSLVRQAHKMTALVRGPIHYQATDRQTSFSSYLLDELLPNISQAKSNLVQDEIFRIYKSAPISETTFKLSGSYWVHDKVVDIRLSLVNKQGEAAYWKGRVLKRYLQGIKLHPAPDKLVSGKDKKPAKKSKPPVRQKPAAGGLTSKEAFAITKSVGTVEAWDAFIDDNPTGFWAKMAKAERNKLIRKTRPKPPRVAQPQPPRVVQPQPPRIIPTPAPVIPTYRGRYYRVCRLNPLGDNFLALRSCESSKCQMIRKLPPNQYLRALSPRSIGRWREVVVLVSLRDQGYSGDRGWVFDKYICRIRN